MRNVFVITLIATLALLASSAEASWHTSLNLGFIFPPTHRTVVYEAPVAYCPPPAYNYYTAAPVYYAEPPYPCTVTPTGYDEVRVSYYSDGYRHYQYYPRSVWYREGWRAHHDYGHRW